jgi:hypothetical protein
MSQTQKFKTGTYDLEDRTIAFAKRVGSFVKRLPKLITNVEYGKTVSKIVWFHWRKLYRSQ